MLLLEQDAILRRQYSTQVGKKYEVASAKSAQEALDILDDGIEFDLIVMDINIDNNNGVEILHELRSYDDWLNIPIVILSSVPESRFAKMSLERYGVVRFLYKPMTSPPELVKIVSRVLSKDSIEANIH